MRKKIMLVVADANLILEKKLFLVVEKSDKQSRTFFLKKKFISPKGGTPCMRPANLEALPSNFKIKEEGART
jgi:hypothetical protein